ncbi:MAG: alpha-glucan family phosphorylase [Dehalococcoidales bacterium]|nr:alpha-glucan family phosphorylase [Dehalococcoidales bacterium]
MEHMIPDRITGLNNLAYNLWWSWHNEARELYKMLDRPLWKATGHNPVKLLQQIPVYKLVAAAEHPLFLRQYDRVMEHFNSDLADSGQWCLENHPELNNHTIAYFSMEFALHNSLPLYAGGLGILAGDFCKESSDLGLPIVGVGFMYPQGYFSQRISNDGWQEEIYRELQFGEAPVTPVYDTEKSSLKIQVELDSRSIWITVWQVMIGRSRLYLLDTNLEENCAADRLLSARLYSGNNETRIQQEIVLGIGGVRVIRALGISPTIWHANEGHAGLMMLERCRELVEQGQDFTNAVDMVRASTVFTTHTPVPAGNDAFPRELMEKYLHRYWENHHIDPEACLEMGSVKQGDKSFNMTVLGMKMAGCRNGVSKLHGAVCRRMWNCIWPDKEENEVPISAVTNGVHVPTWISPRMARLYEEYLGSDWLNRHDDPGLWQKVDKIPDDRLWDTHRWLKRKLISFIVDRCRQRWSCQWCDPVHTLAMGTLFDSETLTLGFSRRFTDYKRAFLILSDPERLKRLLRDDLRPIQIIFAGKAHPNDHNGKLLIQQVYNLAKNPEFGGRLAFVEDYDMHAARYLVQGVDVWLNTPRLFQEASGTSGMKASLNGVPHLSVLDGWWFEGYNTNNGWAVHRDLNRPDNSDREDAGELFQLLENHIVPLYYDRDINGIPGGWIRVMKNAISSITPAFSARRMVKDYTEQMYIRIARAGYVRAPAASLSR